MNKLITICVLGLLATGCMQTKPQKSSLETNLVIDINPNEVPLIPLKPGEEPLYEYHRYSNFDEFTAGSNSAFLNSNSDGYTMIGRSYMASINIANMNSVKELAKKIGATKVIEHTINAGTITTSTLSAIPTFNSFNGTSRTSGIGSSYGTYGSYYGVYNGMSSYSGTSMSTTFTPVKNTYASYSNIIQFYAKTPYYGVPGFIVNEISDEEKRQLKSNYGVKINSIEKGSVEYRDGFFVGDIIVKVNETYVDSYNSLLEAVTKKDNDGKMNRIVNFVLFRDGEYITKSVNYEDTINQRIDAFNDLERRNSLKTKEN